MENQLKITHRQLISYIQDKADITTQKHIKNNKEKDAIYELFFELIDKFKSLAVIKDKPDTAETVLLPFSVIDDMLIRFFSGNINKSDAQQIIDGLLFSPVFYKRFINQLTPAIPQVELKEIPELAQVQVKSDDELLNDIKKNLHKPPDLGYPPPEWLKIFIVKIVIIMAYLNRQINRIPKYVYIALITAMGGIIATFPPTLPFGSINWNPFVEQYPYERSSFMGAIVGSEGDSLFYFFKTKFGIGISNYMYEDYPQAIHIFQSIEPVALNLQEKTKDQSFMPWMRDLYFYWGLSHLHQAIKQGSGKSAESKHVQHSIYFLSRADLITTLFSLERRDAEAYYLGIAYAMDEEKNLAIIQLKKIKKGCKLYDKSVELIYRLKE